jgi:uncharacterized flavoprotein (TIGR03862 family)
LIAAGVLARAGARVTIYEHKASPARKFLMAGRGGLNLTHSESLERLVTRYGAAGKRLGPLIRAFPPQALRDFCAELGEETFVGSSGRVFPKSFKTSPLLRAMLARLAALGVTIETRHSFEGFASGGAPLLRGPDGALFVGKTGAVVLALGGASWPRLGSDGHWAEGLAARGVRVTPLAPANCGALVEWSARFRADFEGQPIKTVLLRHGAETARGDIVVTKTGLEGGPVYALSSRLRNAVEREGSAILRIDLRPDATMEILTRKLSRRAPKQSRANFLRKAAGLSKAGIALLRESQPGGLPKDAVKLTALIKNAPVTVQGVAGLERAISSAGGVAFTEVTDDLMLKKMPGVFVAGEMLDFNAPTGGYLLQAAFSTGAAAGEGAARYLGLLTGEDPSHPRRVCGSLAS